MLLEPALDAADKRPRSDDDSNVARRAGSSAGKSSLRASLEVDISKSGRSVGLLELPDLKPHQRCTFGRGPEADVKLEHASLSRLHADLAVSLDGVVTLTDLGSGALL